MTQISDAVVSQVREYCDRLDESLDSGRGLWFFGNSGTGKTTLAMLVSKLTIETGRTAAIYSMPQLLSRIRQTFDSLPGEESYLDLFGQLTSVDLLLLDDLGSENRTEWVLEQLYALINERYEAERSLVVTTNLTAEKLEEQIGERVVSRLVEMCGDPLPLYGDDRRLKVAPPPSDSAS
ncbi:MAG: ATP-binding protein [Solirubrobacterales bacterium]